MKKFFLFVFLFLSATLLLAKNLKEPDLIKFYIEKQDYESALSVIQNAKIDSSFMDSLAFFKAIICEKTNKPEKAIKIYSHIIFSSPDSNLINISKKMLFKILKKEETSYSIEVLSTILDSLSNKNLRKDLLFALADIYERNLLYNEANDVYQTILSDTLNVDTLNILMKIASNDIYLKEFTESRAILDTLLQNNSLQIDSLKILYLKAFTYYKENNFDMANELFLNLYKNYPNHPERWNVIYFLSKTFLYKKQYLVAWYLLDELYKISSESQKFKLYDEIQSLKTQFLNDKTSTDQFKYFVPKWEIKNE